MPKPRVNPFPRGTAENVLYGRFRQARLAANASATESARTAVEARAHEAKAQEYAKALQALGHDMPDNAPPAKTEVQRLLPALPRKGEPWEA